jgi:hypothetical protein
MLSDMRSVVLDQSANTAELLHESIRNPVVVASAKVRTNLVLQQDHQWESMTSRWCLSADSESKVVPFYRAVALLDGGKPFERAYSKNSVSSLRNEVTITLLDVLLVVHSSVGRGVEPWKGLSSTASRWLFSCLTCPTEGC